MIGTVADTINSLIIILSILLSIIQQGCGITKGGNSPFAPDGEPMAKLYRICLAILFSRISSGVHHPVMII